jgi:predicted signal transduction protein with EAL and GGDEF domain
MTALIVIIVIGLCIAFMALAPAWITIGIIILLILEACKD